MSLIQFGQDLRRVQRLGGSSLVVTIPKQWARKIGLTPGDQVAIIDEGSSLRIVPIALSGSVRGRTLRIRVNSIIEKLGLERVIRCAYTLGYRGVRIEWNPRTVKLDLERVASLLEASPSVESYRIGVGSLELEFAPADGDPSVYLRRLSSHVLQALESGDGIDTRVIEELYSNIIKSAAERTATAPQDVVPLSLVMPLADLALIAASSVGEGEAERLRVLIAEILGGASAGSLKRLVHALELAEKLEEEAMSGDTSRHGLLRALAVVARRFLEAAICQRLAE